MIPFSVINSVSERLEAFRSNEAGLIIYDAHCRGNYANYDLKKNMGILEKHDPTGFAASMMLDEMLENTIEGATVKAVRVLREEGFIERLRQILSIKDDLCEFLDAPRAAFIERIGASLRTISSDLETPSSREIAVCLRDAIHCMDNGLTMRWLLCENEFAGDMALCLDVRSFDTMTDFTHSLMTEMSFGAHLACVAGFTVIGLKQPGRISYLSKLSLDEHTGTFLESQTSQYAMSQFDLGKPSERYPAWAKAPGANAVVMANQHTWINKLADLPRDRILWLALIVEMAKQIMAKTDPSVVSLTESMSKALAAKNDGMLPALRVNYEIETKTIEQLFEECEFDEWTKNFMRPALDGLTVDMLLPIGHSPVAFCTKTFEHSTPKSEQELYSYSGGSRAYSAQYLIFPSVSPSIVGTKQEVESVRNRMLGRNFMNYLMMWGNKKIAHGWITNTHDWFKRSLEKNAVRVIQHGSTTTMKNAPTGPDGVMDLYNQSAKHVAYKARCWFDEDAEPTHAAVIEIKDSAHLVDLFQLSSELDLPEYLRGWTRLGNDKGGSDAPHSTQRNWAWNNLHAGHISQQMADLGVKPGSIKTMGFLCARILFNEKSLQAPNVKTTTKSRKIQ